MERSEWGDTSSAPSGRPSNQKLTTKRSIADIGKALLGLKGHAPSSEVDSNLKEIKINPIFMNSAIIY